MAKHCIIKITIFDNIQIMNIHNCKLLTMLLDFKVVNIIFII